MNNALFNGKKVLVTGHTGFKGSWLTLWLLKLGAKLTGISLAPKTKFDNYVLTGLKNHIEEYIEDIRNFGKINDIVNKTKPEVIFHLAAQSLVLESYKNPLYTFETNTLGTSNILEAFRNSHSANVLILITSDKVYENKEWVWGFREEDILGGRDPYSASKAACEFIANSYWKSFFSYEKNAKLIATVRAGNVIGGGDWSEHRIIPDCIKSLEDNKAIIIRNPTAIRPWQFVLEPLNGYLLLAEKLMNGESRFTGSWNFGPDRRNMINVDSLAKKVIEKYGSGNYTVSENEEKPHEAKFLYLDISKAVSLLKWEPILNLDETIDFTIDWYKNYKRIDVFDLCDNQINKFEDKWKSRKEN